MSNTSLSYKFACFWMMSGCVVRMRCVGTGRKVDLRSGIAALAFIFRSLGMKLGYLSNALSKKALA